eukprot:GGOE01000686.1.p1 GENE.GGOE01000686.1~~GGOE01000686.1.p1  ORF type:complete len:321 (-),score=45.68 GGOE01000686.1:280-1242(-)
MVGGEPQISRFLWAIVGIAMAAVLMFSVNQFSQLENFIASDARSQVGSLSLPHAFTQKASSKLATPKMAATQVSILSGGEAGGLTVKASHMAFGLMAAVTTFLGAVAMKFWNRHNEAVDMYRAECNAATPLTFRTSSPFSGSRMDGPDFSHDARSVRLLLQAAPKGAKGGKGKGKGPPVKGKVAGIIKLALPAGKATPAPPVGPALGQYGLNIVQFCKEYNAATEKEAADAMIIPVEITAFEDRTFKFVLKTPPASVLLRKAAGASKGSATPSKDMVGSISKQQLEEIAKTKLPDLNTKDVEMAMKVVAGTARSMGITIE